MALITPLEHMAGSSSGLRLAYVLVAFILFSVLQYALAVSRFRSGKNGISTQRPPLLPHLVPFLGIVPVDYVLSPLKYLHTFPGFWQRQPVRVRSFFQDVYIVQGAKDLISLVKQPSISSFPVHKYVIGNVFLLPKPALATHANDNSGAHSKPHPGSNVEHRNRIEYHFRNSVHEVLLGQGQASLLRRLYASTTSRLDSLGIGQEWTHFPDLVRLLKHQLTAASVDALTGPTMMQRNPTFAEDIWTIDEYSIRFLFKLPRFFIPKAYQVRERAIEAVQNWRAWANDNFRPESIDEDGNDPYWGCSVFRKRNALFSAMDGFSPRAMASEELSFIWSAQTNAVVSTFWLVLETFRNPELLELVRAEVQPCVQDGPDGRPQIDVTKLTHQPFLQAMFAESLRLHIHGFFLRYLERGSIVVNGWDIPKDHWCIASNTPAHMDPEFWCTGEAQGHPVEEFWPWRFCRRDVDTGELKFSLEGTEGHWIPFGGGPHTCPGRMYAKRLNFFTLALMVTMYDCDVLASDAQLQMDGKKFPCGAIRPCDAVPVRMRRRQQKNQ